MSSVSVRRAEARDLSFIVESQVAMAQETEQLTLDRDTVRAGVRGVLEHPERGFYLLACVAEEPAASMLVLSEWSDWRNCEVWWLHSVFVAPEQRQSGLFRCMFEAVERQARAHGCAGLRLYVDRRNTQAQAVYRALGMGSEHYELFETLF